MQKTVITIFIFHFSFLIFFSCSKNSTPPETVTFSGTVTLEGETDHSGVTISLYKPVLLDTALVRINQQYPGIGVPISQETEFDHREHTPVYSTTTDASGHWQIENVTPGEYNVVAEKDSFGWRYAYNRQNNSIHIELKKTIYLRGQYDVYINIPMNSFVQINGNVQFTSNSSLNIQSGSIVECENGSSLEIYGQMTCSGESNYPILFSSKNKSDSWRLKLMQNSISTMDYCYFFTMPNGIYFNSIDTTAITHCRFQKGIYALEFFNSTKVLIQNNFISHMQDGIRTNNSHTIIEKNIISQMSDNGILSLNEKNSSWQYNVFDNCSNSGVALNPSGYAYSDTWVNIIFNDFKDNKDHIVLGQKGWCEANYNNFINELNYIIKTSAIIDIDTLDFRNNYWSYLNPYEIDQKIYDKNDMSGIPNQGCIIDYRDFLINYFIWN